MINPLQLHMVPTAYDLAATEPDVNSTVHLLSDPKRAEAMSTAMSNQVRLNTLGKRQGPVQYTPVEAPYLSTPSTRLSGIQEQLSGSDKYASNGRNIVGNNTIQINPNANKAYFMHELGHLASREGRIGGLVRTARDNPMLTKALGSARFALPLGISALTPGDDDLAQSVIASYAASLPTILDEALASKNAFSMMKNMGERATPGQRTRLAGSFLSYLGAPMLAALGTNYAGNLMDDEIAERLTR